MTLTPDSPSSAGLTFGIYPGMTGAERDESSVVMPTVHLDDPARTRQALSSLEGSDRSLLVRGYLVYRGGPDAAWITPRDLLDHGEDRRLDVVLCYRSTDGDVNAWCDYVRRMVARFGAAAATIQITEEPNNPNAEMGGDGSAPNVREAMIEGVIAATREALARGYPVEIGVGVTPSFNPADDFWPDVARRATPEFLASLDYVGLDFFPDVFRPVALDDIEKAVEWVVTHFRCSNLSSGGIPESVPIHVTEHGWPTGADRPPERQAEILERVVRTIHRLRSKLNITHYEFFLLRDADSTRPEMGYQWGLLRHDYTPKPAFEAFRQMISDLGTASAA
jgi:hypothetical protein